MLDICAVADNCASDARREIVQASRAPRRSLVEALAERRAQVSQLATENILSSSDTCYLAALPDELKEQVLVACFEPRDMAALARCSREFAALLREDNVWSMLVERRWPHLAWAPVAPHSRTPSLDLHRERAHVADDDIGAAYELCAAFDESAALADGDDFDALARSLLRACVGVRRAAGNNERAREREVLRWQHRCARAVGVPARLTDLAAWARALEEELDLWYDEGDAGDFLVSAAAAAARRRAALLRVLTGRSALRFLLSEVLHSDYCDRHLLVSEGRADIANAVADIDASLRSLHLEACDLSVPPSLRPAVPPTHWWWFIRPPVYVSGGCPYPDLRDPPPPVAEPVGATGGTVQQVAAALGGGGGA